MQINARLDGSYAEKLEFLQAATHLSLSDIVRDSVDRYYEAVLAEHLGHSRILSSDLRDFGAYRWKNREPFTNLLLPA